MCDATERLHNTHTLLAAQHTIHHASHRRIRYGGHEGMAASAQLPLSPGPKTAREDPLCTAATQALQQTRKELDAALGMGAGGGDGGDGGARCRTQLVTMDDESYVHDGQPWPTGRECGERPV